MALDKKSRAVYVGKRLDELYPQPTIPLKHEDPYTLLVSVVLSAQCTDLRVNQITPQLFRRANSPQTMMELAVEEIESIIRPCGLSRNKSKAIWGLSKILCEAYGARVPNTFEDLEALPGVGHKTASVVMAQAFGKPAFPVDTHIHRLARRWSLTSGENVRQTEKDLKDLFPEGRWHDLHLQMIYYGRAYCTARGCDGTRCEICKNLLCGACLF